MKKFFISLCQFCLLYPLLLLTACHENAASTGVEHLESVIGHDAITHIQQAKQVTIYSMASPQEKQTLHIAGYPIKKELLVANKDFAHELKSIFLNDDNYEFKLKKRCAFAPQYTLQFQDQGRSLDVMFSTSCEKVGFYSATLQKMIIIDSDPGKELWEYISNYLMVMGGKS